MSLPIAEYGRAVNRTTTGDVVLGNNCILLGFMVNNTNVGTLQLRQGGSGGTILGAATSPPVGYGRFPAACKGGLHATIGGTALDVTFFVVDGQL